MINDKVHCSKVASLYGKEYWDGERKYGYGGYHYIPGRWHNLAKNLINDEIVIGMGAGSISKYMRELKFIL